ncbi:MAG: tetratricopeptide repeat protein [Leptospirales bacterium]|nr:tetratricopeptide repeat protein [Leptospirales bacterium]
MNKKLNLSLIIILFVSSLLASLLAQSPNENTDDYRELYENKDYEKSYNIVISRINEIYSKMVEEKRVPVGYRSLTNLGEDVDLVSLFRNRKEKGFFIEDNGELSELHLFAARNSVQLDKKRDGLNNYIQSLRFRKIELQRDDVIFYEISQLLKTYNDPLYFKGYIDALEQAYTLNQTEYKYSLELGNALYTTKEIKKSIFHLKRYVENSQDTIDPVIYLKLASLYEGIEKYLETEKYYNEYLRLKPDDAEILFALGHIAYLKTGNYILAESFLQRALTILKNDDIYRRSKSYEYLGDMLFNNLKYSRAIEHYQQCINYQTNILQSIDSNKTKRSEKNAEINKLKEALINNKEFDKYEEYEILVDERNKIDKDIEVLQLEFTKLQPGKVRWNLAVSYEKIEQYEDAINYYREAITYNYNPNSARDMIVKLKLKIKRGY